MANKFEVTMGRLVEARLHEKSPALAPFKVGFEVKDFDEEGRRGVGFYAFMLNGTPAIMPAIYRRGSLKGLDMLWLPESKVFVPADDGWISLLRTQGGAEVAKLLRREDASKLRAMPAESVKRVVDVFPYVLKTAAESRDPLVKASHILDMLSVTFRAGRDGSQSPLLGSLDEMSPERIAVLCKTSLEDAEVADCVCRRFGNAALVASLARARERLDSRADKVRKTSAEAPGVKLITDMDDVAVLSLSNSERKALVKYGSVVTDFRREATQVFGEPRPQSLLVNPTKTGWHMVLDSDGDFKRAWVSRVSYFPGVALVVPEGHDEARVFPRDALWVRHVGGLEVDDGTESAQPGSKVDAGFGGSKSDGDCCSYGGETWLLLPPSSEAVAIGVSGKGVVGLAEWLPSVGIREQKPTMPENVKGRTLVLEVAPDCASIDATSTRMRVGDGVRAVKMASSDKSFPLVPGDHEAMLAALTGRHGLVKMAVESDGHGARINSGGSMGRLTDVETAFRGLVFQHGLRPAAARDLLVEAEAGSGKGVSVLLKYAAGFKPDETVPAARETTSETTIQRVSVMPEDATRKLVEASKSGSRDLIDAEMIKGLMEATGREDMDSELVVKLTRAMSACGQRLMTLQWNWDDEEERYGAEDMASLERHLSELFGKLGELVLYMRERFSGSFTLNDSVEDSGLGSSVAAFSA